MIEVFMLLPSSVPPIPGIHSCKEKFNCFTTRTYIDLQRLMQGLRKKEANHKLKNFERESGSSLAMLDDTIIGAVARSSVICVDCVLETSVVDTVSQFLHLHGIPHTTNTAS